MKQRRQVVDSSVVAIKVSQEPALDQWIQAADSGVVAAVQSVEGDARGQSLQAVLKNRRVCNDVHLASGSRLLTEVPPKSRYCRVTLAVSGLRSSMPREPEKSTLVSRMMNLYVKTRHCCLSIQLHRFWVYHVFQLCAGEPRRRFAVELGDRQSEHVSGQAQQGGLGTSGSVTRWRGHGRRGPERARAKRRREQLYVITA